MSSMVTMGRLRAPGFSSEGFPAPSNFSIMRRIGRIIASRQIMSISAPDMPSVRLAQAFQSTSGDTEDGVRVCLNIVARASCVGSPTRIRFSRRRSIALSRSHGVLLAARTKTTSPPRRFDRPSI
ncbi:hypothetical protein, unlikely [Trypanosoma congolense IL3000]|uniref:Uncharacterized protein n=1 Tax=Trypanosoma congolense (strain IL3000) TaxID=1068625 RepID=F9W5Z0_TRYCI|nr:hypothetical protein, unlikely [Trypanosoma congolense IL3000]